jgi:hypothetical protein
VKRLAVAWSILFSCTCTVALAADLEGWAGTRWGMNPEAIQKVHPEMAIGKGPFGLTAGVMETTVVNARFHVFFEFADVGGMHMTTDTRPEPPQGDWKLARVELHGPRDACLRVNEALISKYGQPSKVDRSMNLSLWIMPTTTIRLIDGDAISSDCEVIYHPTQKADSL